MTVATIVAAIAAVVGTGGIGAVVTAVLNSKRGNAQSETEARAQFTAEFNAVVGAMGAQYERLESEVSMLREEVRSIRAEHQAAELFIDTLITGITNGTIPPIPPRK